MPLRAKVNYPRLAKEATKRRLDKAMNEAVIEALRTWVIATTDNVPVLTGASKASFLKLSRQAQVALTIVPKTISRIQFGFDTSVGEIISENGVKYGWEWRSDLSYIQIVDARNSFLAAGESALKNQKHIPLPPPVFESEASR